MGKSKRRRSYEEAACEARDEKAEAIVDAGDIQVVDEKDGKAYVRSQSDPSMRYHVVVEERFCDCPDSAVVICKHIRAVAMTLGGLSEFGLDSRSRRNRSYHPVPSEWPVSVGL